MNTTSWDWNYAWEVLPEVLSALVVTVRITVLGTAIAMVLGLVWALVGRSRVRLLRWTTRAFVEVVRDTPLLVQVYFLYFVLPVTGVRLSAIVTGTLAIGLNYSAYTAEVYRAGIDGVPRAQWEAARALNLDARQTWTRIVLPQAIPAVIPALGNYLISMFKDTPILSAIGIIEMLNRAKIIGSTSFRYLEPITEVGLLFVAISYPASVLVRRLEDRFSQPGAAPGGPRRKLFARQTRAPVRL